MTDLYKTLGVKRDATHDQIRKAYRKRSKRYHPDMPTGNAARFAVLKIAHDVLTDVDARAHYDLTGEIMQRKLEGADDAEFMNAIAALLQRALERMQSPERQNLVESMKCLTTADRATVKGRHSSLTMSRKKLGQVQERLKRKDGTAQNVLGALLASQITEVERQLTLHNNLLAMIDRIEKFLADYDYNADVETSYQFQPFGMLGASLA